MHRDPAADPNQVWIAITRDYLRIRPHPEFSLNYAAGAILVADLRQRANQLHGPYSEGDPSWYAFMSGRIYRHGLARSLAARARSPAVRAPRLES